MADDLDTLFVDLRARMLAASPGMTVATDDPGNLVLKTPWTEPGKSEPAWFAAVQRKKNYVSCHLMPIYCLPELRAGVSPDLEKRMQGKSCFNFKKPDPDLFDTLSTLITTCATAYAEPVDTRPH